MKSAPDAAASAFDPLHLLLLKQKKRPVREKLIARCRKALPGHPVNACIAEREGDAPGHPSEHGPCICLEQGLTSRTGPVRAPGALRKAHAQSVPARPGGASVCLPSLSVMHGQRLDERTLVPPAAEAAAWFDMQRARCLAYQNTAKKEFLTLRLPAIAARQAVISEADDPLEETPGGILATGTVKQITLKLAPAGLTGTLTLTAVSGGSRIRLWRDAGKTSPLTLPAEWELSGGYTFPTVTLQNGDYVWTGVQSENGPEIDMTFNSAGTHSEQLVTCHLQPLSNDRHHRNTLTYKRYGINDSAMKKGSLVLEGTPMRLRIFLRYSENTSFRVVT